MTTIEALLFWFMTMFGLGDVFGTSSAPPLDDSVFSSRMTSSDSAADESASESKRKGGSGGKPADRIYNGF